MKRFNKYKGILIKTLFIIMLLIFLYLQNNHISVNEIRVRSNRVPKAYEGLRIVHISDLHGKTFGKDQKRLMKKIKKAKPDMIFVTGDTVDSRRYNEEPALLLFQQAVEIAPVYLVPGNHEGRSGRFDAFSERLKTLGVKVIRNESWLFRQGAGEFVLAGLDDPEFQQEDQLIIPQRLIDEIDGRFSIVLSHRPEYLSDYAASGFDLVFSGHAHGGQVRVPFIGGLYAPHQGLFPKLTCGSHQLMDTTLVISRGMGNSIAPLRLFNPPELVVVILESEN